MAEDLSPKVIATHDSAQFLPGRGARETTVVQFMIGRFGPFEHTFDRNPQKFEIERVMNEKRAALDGLV